MGENSAIGWTDHTYNLWWGCTEVGGDPACDECYARDTSENPFWWAKQSVFKVWGNDKPRRFFSDAHYTEPLKWNRKAEKAGVPARVFCMSMGDWAEGRPDCQPYLDKYLFPMIERTPWLIWLLLTKRPQLAQKLVPESWRNGWPRNVCPGITAVTQKWFDIRSSHLLAIPATTRFVSYEPAMEAIDFGSCLGVDRIGWLIAGGESGSKARPANPDWFRGARDQCRIADIPFFFKQNGEWIEFRQSNLVEYPPKLRTLEMQQTSQPDQCSTITMCRVGKKEAGSLLDGVDWKQFPDSHTRVPENQMAISETFANI